jgi:hypothetical protein
MRAVVFKGPFEVGVEQVADPRIEQPPDAIVRITAANICGSDLHPTRSAIGCPSRSIWPAVLAETATRGEPDRGGQGTENGSDAGILRLEFPDGPQGDSSDLDSVDWEAFFATFDQRNLAFVYQEKTSDGEVSRFNKFVSRQD